MTYQHLDVAQTGVQGLVLNLHVAIRSMQVEVVDVSVTGKKIVNILLHRWKPAALLVTANVCYSNACPQSSQLAEPPWTVMA